MSTFSIIAVSLFFITTQSQTPCIPANTCFPINIGDSGATVGADGAYMINCAASGITPRVGKTKWYNNGVNVCAKQTSGSSKSTLEILSANGATGQNAGTAVQGVITAGSASGAISTDYIMGTNCPVLDQSSDNCVDYMVVKRYGNKAWVNPTNDEELPYQDIGKGTNGTNEDGDGECPGLGTEADYFAMPVGCINLVYPGGSLDYFINDTHFGYISYELDNCAGTSRTAQSDIWRVDACGIFYERTHCGNNAGGTQTICSTGGVLVTYDYRFDAECGPNLSNHAACNTIYNTASQIMAPTTASGTTKEPTEVNSCPACPGGTPKPTSSPQVGVTNKPTASPQVGTGSSNTPNPTSSPQVGVPSPTKAPQVGSGGSGSVPTAPTTSGCAMRDTFIVIIGCIFALMM